MGAALVEHASHQLFLLIIFLEIEQLAVDVVAKAIDAFILPIDIHLNETAFRAAA